MKKIFSLIFIMITAIPFTLNANTQTAISNSVPGDHTAREEAEGKEIWQKLQSKEIDCANLSDENFGTLGEHFMGQMIGSSHAIMNTMMTQMHGEKGEEQIHIVMGKRLSGCDTSAAISGISGGWMPMMNMMTGGWSSPFGFNNQSNNSMMNFGFGSFGGFGWIFMFLWWVLIIAGIVALVRWLSDQFRRESSNKSALDILKERYAKSEIDKKEFEERKKDLL